MYDYTKIATIFFYNVIQALFFCLALAVVAGHPLGLGVFLLVLLALLFHPYEKSGLLR